MQFWKIENHSESFKILCLTAQMETSLDHVNLEVVFKMLEEWSKMYDL